MAAASLYLVIRICDFKVAWNSFLVELTGLTKTQVSKPAAELCQLYLDVCYNEDRLEGKKEFTKVLDFKYSEDKYLRASKIRPQK